MSRFRTLLTLALAVLILMDLTLALAIRHVGWPPLKELMVTTDPHNGTARLQVVELPFTTWDWLGFAAVIAVLIAATVALAYLAWRAWYPSEE